MCRVESALLTLHASYCPDPSGKGFGLIMGAGARISQASLPASQSGTAFAKWLHPYDRPSAAKKLGAERTFADLDP